MELIDRKLLEVLGKMRENKEQCLTYEEYLKKVRIVKGEEKFDGDISSLLDDSDEMLQLYFSSKQK